MQRKPPRPTLALVVLLLSAGLTATPADAQGADWTIDEETVLAKTTRSVSGDIVIHSGAELRLEGATLKVGGRILVEAGGTLTAGPSDGQASQILPTDPEEGFWIRVDGTMTTQGTPSTLIEGLNGDGLESAVGGGGGLDVAGTARLTDVHIRDSTSGVVVEETGDLRVEDSLLEDLGFAGVAVRGRAVLVNDTFIGSSMAVTGRSTCDITLVDSETRALGNGLHVNGCNAGVRNTRFVGGQNGVVLTSDAVVAVLDSTIVNSTVSGASARQAPGESPGGPLLKPTLFIANSVLEANHAPADPGALDARVAHGITPVGAALLALEKTTVRGFEGSGIYARESTLLLRNSTFEGNGRFGVHAFAGTFQQDPLDSGNRFGSEDPVDRNGQGPIRHTRMVTAWATDIEEQATPGLSLSIYAEGSDEPVYEVVESPEVSVRARFEAYETDGDGDPVYLGQFRYETQHPELDHSTRGDLGPSQTTLVVPLAVVEEPWYMSTATLAFLGVGALLMVYAVFGDAVRRRVWPRHQEAGGSRPAENDESE